MKKIVSFGRHKFTNKADALDFFAAALLREEIGAVFGHDPTEKSDSGLDRSIMLDLFKNHRDVGLFDEHVVPVEFQILRNEFTEQRIFRGQCGADVYIYLDYESCVSRAFDEDDEEEIDQV